MNYQIDTFKITHLSYKSLAEFLRTVRMGIEAITPERLQVADLLPSFEEVANTFSAYTTRQRKSNYTQDLTEIIQIKNKDFALLKKIIRAYTYSSDSSEQKSAKSLISIFSSQNLEFEAILSKEENAKNLDFLGLTSIAKRLVEINQEIGRAHV